MYTQCPDCLTVYRVEAEQLVPACGCLRCGHCQELFCALSTLTAQLPPEPFSRLEDHALDREPPVAVVAVFRPRTDAVPLADIVEPDVEAAALPAPEHDPIGGDFAGLTFTPAFAKPRRRPWRSLAWVLVFAVLVLGLGAQLAWAKRDALITDPAIGRALAAGCSMVGCRVPLVARPALLHLLARDVEQHPTVPDGLLITASVRNDAPFGQPYPVVTLVLSDANGQRLAMRRFQPDDYVGDAAARARGLAGGATTAMVFEVQDPGQRAVSFTFGFE